MCGIVASFSKEKLKELILLNQSRGTFSHSLMVLETAQQMPLKQIALHKGFGEFNFDLLDEYEDGKNYYYITHVQAPTQGLVADYVRIHPSTIDNTYLYHNGIIQNKTLDVIKANNDKLKNLSWDTELFHYHIKDNINNVNEINGSFACIYIENSIKLFRNSMSILHYDFDLNISSTGFDGALELFPGQVFRLDLTTKTLDKEFNFTCEKNYFFAD